MAREDRSPLSELEIASGWVFGYLAEEPEAEVTVQDGPVPTLEEALLPSLAEGVCYVAFSGGRDSSIVLALAVRVARREGLPDPIPITTVHPDVPEADDGPWAELLVRQLGLEEWERLTIRDELDLLAPRSRGSLLAHGLLWPPAAHTKHRILDVARGATLLTGEGGDEVLGPRRGAPLARIWDGHTGLRELRAAANASAPAAWRRHRVRRRLLQGDGWSWLRPQARRTFADRLATDLASEPLRWGEGLRAVLRMRSLAIGLDSLGTIADDHGVRYVHPLLDSRFVASLAATGPRFGFPSRTSALRSIFAGLLPDEILERTKKAVFNDVAVGRHSREFISGWTGQGVHNDLVDPGILRAVWGSRTPHAGSLLLLHRAWLAQHNRLAG